LILYTVEFAQFIASSGLEKSDKLRKQVKTRF